VDKKKGRPSPFILVEADGGYQAYQNAQNAYLDSLVDRWSWLIEGTKKMKDAGLEPINPKLWRTMAILFENQHAVCNGFMTEATTKTDVTLPEKFALPIIRKVYPRLWATRVASVQPMPLSSGGVAKIFWMDFYREDVTPNTNLATPDSDYALSEENAVPKRVKMQIVSSSVEAEKDILGATWSTEVQEDARGAMNIDVEAELVNQMSMEILREMDQRVISEMLIWAGAGNQNWAWTVPAGYASPKDYYETLGHSIIDAEGGIFDSRYRWADWVLGGRNFVSFIRKMQDFRPSPRNNTPNPFDMGVRQVGTLEGYWDIYLSAHINTNRAIVGVYPRSDVDTSYIIAPYIPLTPMPLIYAEFKAYDDATMPGAYVNVDKWSRNVRTRWGKKLVVPELLATLSIAA